MDEVEKPSYEFKLTGLRYEEARWLYAKAIGVNVEELHGSPGMSFSGAVKFMGFTLLRVGAEVHPERKL